MSIWSPRNKCVVAALAMLLPLVASAGKTAYVNMETLFEGYYKTLRANVVFEQKKRDFQERVELLKDELKEMVITAKKLDEEASNELLSEEARAESKRKLQFRVERLRAKDDEFQQFRKGGFRDLQSTRMSAEEKLIEDLIKLVRTYCEGRDFDLVYDVTGRSLNRMPVLLLYPKEQEITDDILKQINAGHEEELTKAKAEMEALNPKKKMTQPDAAQEKDKPAAPAAGKE